MIQAQLDRLRVLLGGDIAEAIVGFPTGQALLAGDGAVPIGVDATYQITKGTAGAFTIAAPGAANIGRVIDIISTTAAAHVLTFTGNTLRGGTAAVATWTAAAQIGTRITIRAISATVWQLERNFGGTLA